MDASQIILGTMDQWKSGIDDHDPARVGALVTEDAVFQGLRPYGVGRDAVADYYNSQPSGMTVTYQILESRSPAANVVHGYLNATFSYVDRAPVELAIGVVLVRFGEQWRVAQYQASQVP
ncbi:nuclear transport factor 2 family protein [Mycolicibacterium mengxianglii]|uniref:nuclear transport factor 2 family protein n=1 Tax=Mycolicibacterium mengxianglii TaxID=2736649 RepID=UPI0018EEE52E|nr:nuclear transport factor 2 family protein [Mycolicibacterium mengxianglii]